MAYIPEIVGSGLQSRVERVGNGLVHKHQNKWFLKLLTAQGVDISQYLTTTIDLALHYFPRLVPPTRLIVEHGNPTIEQAELFCIEPFEGYMCDIKRYSDVIDYLAIRNRQMILDTGFTVDVMGMSHFLLARRRLATNPEYFGLPNLQVNHFESILHMPDTGFFNIREESLISTFAYCNLVPFMHIMGERMGIELFPRSLLFK